MKNRIWDYVIRSIPEDMMLPKWAIFIRVILFPLDTFYWKMSKSRGYQFKKNIWIIDGKEYSARSLKLLYEADGQIFKISHNGRVWRITKISTEKEL